MNGRIGACALVALIQSVGAIRTKAATPGCGTLPPCTVGYILEVGNLEKVAVLGVDRTNDVVDECGIVVHGFGIVRKFGPFRIDGELVVFAAAVNGPIVLSTTSWPFLAITL